ncbi:hypothetical protein [Buttiauxella ferragutiae]|uniref:hypothetical protein n=1 Tax=Buttiauxella ferragutiae TaxID=82989 RepID=UPI003526AC62
MNSRLFTSYGMTWHEGLSGSDAPGAFSGKKLFFGLTVHSVHPAFLLFKIIMLGDEQTVKGEQSIVHPDHVQA